MLILGFYEANTHQVKHLSLLFFYHHDIEYALFVLLNFVFLTVRQENTIKLLVKVLIINYLKPFYLMIKEYAPAINHSLISILQLLFYYWNVTSLRDSSIRYYPMDSTSCVCQFKCQKIITQPCSRYTLSTSPIL